MHQSTVVERDAGAPPPPEPSRARAIVASTATFLHHNLLWLLVGSYVLAALLPGPGLALRTTSVGSLPLFHLQQSSRVTPPMLLLALLLFNAGMGMRFHRGRWREAGMSLGCGIAGNLLVPALFILATGQFLHLWHSFDETQNILTGMALVASMPIAGSSTAWSQNVEGDMAVSLGLVLLSTFLSPLTTPILLHGAGWITAGDYSEDLQQLAGGGAGAFLVVFVLLPSLLGMLARAILGSDRATRYRPAIKIVNTAALLLLCYTNAAASLPQTVAAPDPDFLLLVLVIVVTQCLFAFSAGWGLGRLLKLERAQSASLLFGLGMSNNGTGMVIATATLADHPLVLLPILFYNLVQHLVAGTADRLLFRNPAKQGNAG